MEFMDSQYQKKRDKQEEKQYHQGKLNQGSKESQQTKQQLQPSTTSSITATTVASPPSPSSSPSHEFSFAVSLQPSSSATSTSSSSTTATRKSTTTDIPIDKIKSSPASFAVDLSPADEIFFHGHLLPLHLLSHLPVSPRSSTNSLDSFTLPIKELSEDGQKPNHISTTNSFNKSEIISNIDHDHSNISNKNHVVDYETRSAGRTTNKSKSFSLFGMSSKWRKENNISTNIDMRDQKEEEDQKERKKRKLKLVDVSHVLKRYIRMVRPLLSFGSRRSGNVQIHRQSNSYSGNLSLRRKPEFRGRREFSAPASMRTSPTNSGLLVATETLSTSSTSDSTMEELQAAIQAAIAHCKNSIAMEEKKIKCLD